MDCASERQCFRGSGYGEVVRQAAQFGCVAVLDCAGVGRCAVGGVAVVAEHAVGDRRMARGRLGDDALDNEALLAWCQGRPLLGSYRHDAIS